MKEEAEGKKPRSKYLNEKTPILLSCKKVCGRHTIQFDFSSVHAFNIGKIQLLLSVTSLGISFSFHAPWYAFVKLLKVRWSGVLPYIKCASF